MQKALKTKFYLLLILTFAFAANFQTAEAQRKDSTTVRITRGQTASQPAMNTANQAAPDIFYTVSMPKPWTHLLEVQMNVNWTQMPDKLEVKMPVWTPGSYLVREYARHVQDFKATDQTGKALMWEKINKNTWQIDTRGAKNVRVGYNVYANELTVRTNELNYEHAFFTPAALLMFPKGHLNAPSTVKVNPYGNWKVATGLKAVPNPKNEARLRNTFRAENFDILYDAPFEVSNFVERTFTVGGKPHRYVITGEGNYDLDKMVADTTKIIEETAKIFGELPYDDYTFILNLRGGGGLEHLNSTALQWDRWGFRGDRYTAFLSLVAHEFFHLYNVKRIRPIPLGPFDYENENYTKLLWVAEGATSYYEGVLMNRAGIVKPDYIFRNEANVLEDLQRQPGRFQTSLEEASFDAWIKYYRRDENAVNNQISYYSKGDVVNFLLDLRIRQASNGAKSLDDVMRYLYDEFYKKDKNFSSEDYQRIAEMMAGTSLREFFNSYVSGREEIKADPILEGIGMRLIESRAESNAAYFGANLRDADGMGLTVASVPANTPAYEWGVNAEDLIVAVDGYRVTSRGMMDFYLSERKANDKIKLTVFRHNRLREIPVTLGKTPASGYRIVPVANPNETQSRLYRQYTGEPLRQTAQ